MKLITLLIFVTSVGWAQGGGTASDVGKKIEKGLDRVGEGLNQAAYWASKKLCRVANDMMDKNGEFPPGCEELREQKGWAVTAQLDYVRGKNKIRSRSEMFVTSDMDSWFELTEPKTGVVLLARKNMESFGEVGFQLMVLDTNIKYSLVNMDMKIQNDQQGELKMSDKEREIVVTIKAKRTKGIVGN